MSSRRGNGSSSRADASGQLSKGKGKADVSTPTTNQLIHGVSDLNLNSAPDEGWEVYGKKSKNRNGGSSAKQSVPQHQSSNAWGHPDTISKLGIRGHGGSGRSTGQTWPTMSSDAKRSTGSGYVVPQAAPVVGPPPANNGWGWSSRASSAQSSEGSLGHMEDARRGPSTDEAPKVDEVEDDSDDSDDDEDSDDDPDSDGFDSDESQKSHETRKRTKWFKELFECLDILTIEQINEPGRQWHCPACKGGPGAIEWYRGLQPLITHAKTKRSKRVKLHRELAELLDEELRRRGTSPIPAGEIFGKWKGLEERADKEIVWPPMVVIMNTRLEKDENEKWIGMGNQELLDYFSSYSAEKARHSYGPQGHRGMSLLIFENSAVGYTEAERLSKHFESTGRDRPAWGRNKVPFYPGGARKLYGFMAEKQDIDNFNQHCQGKTKLKYDMKSYKEMVVNQMKQMSDDNQQLLWYKNKVAKEQKSKKALEESYGVITEKWRKVAEENRMMKNRTKKHHEQNQEQMDFQEKFFREEIQQLYTERNVKEDNFEKMQQTQRDNITQYVTNVSSLEQRVKCREEIAELIQLQDKEMDEYVKERDNLVMAHQQKMMELKRVHLEEEMAVEKEFDANFNKLLQKYTPNY